MQNLLSLWQREPAVVTAVITGLVDAALIAVVAFGVPVTGDQQKAIKGVVEAGLALVGLIVSGVVTRSQVSPVAKVAAPPA